MITLQKLNNIQYRFNEFSIWAKEFVDIDELKAFFKSYAEQQTDNRHKQYWTTAIAFVDKLDDIITDINSLNLDYFDFDEVMKNNINELFENMKWELESEARQQEQD